MRWCRRDRPLQREEVDAIERSACRPAFLFRHVHRKFDELPDRGAGVVAARQRFAGGDASERKQLFLCARECTIVELCHRYYEQDDVSVLPRSHRTFDAFENSIDAGYRNGGSTNTVLHLLAIAYEAGVDFTMKRLWIRLSLHVPTLCKVAPSSEYHMEERASRRRIPAIWGELDRAGLLHADAGTVHSKLCATDSSNGDIAQSKDEAVQKFFRSAPGGIVHHHRLLAIMLYPDVDTDRAQWLHPRQRARPIPKTADWRCARQPSRWTVAS